MITTTITLFNGSNHLISNVNGPPAGNTGSPADNKTCARSGCHNGTASSITGVFSSNIPSAGYTPGQTYTISALVGMMGIVRYGFQITPQDPAGNMMGTLIVTDPSTTKITGTKYITHTAGGTFSPAFSRTWSFDWVAPPAGSGDVVFYGAFNYANNNGSTSGDAIHTSSMTIPENTSVGLNEKFISNLSVYPVPADKFVNIKFYLKDISDIKISLYDLKGKLMFEDIGNMNPGINHINIQSGAFSSGVYLLTLHSKEIIQAQRILIQHHGD